MAASTTKVIDLQNTLLELTEDDVERLKIDIVESCYLSKKSSLAHLVVNILTSIHVRPWKENLYLELVKLLKLESTADPKSAGLIDYVLFSSIVCPLSQRISFLKDSDKMHFLYKCYAAGIIDENLLFPFLRRFNQESLRDSKALVCWLFVYFAPILNKHESELFSALFTFYKDTLKTLEGNQLLPDPAKITLLVGNLNIEDPEFFEIYLNEVSAASELSIRKAIIADDIAELKKLSSAADFSFDSCLQPCVFDQFWCFNDSPSLLASSAFCAPNCFKFLMQNGVSPTLADAAGRTVSFFAVASGNLEIVRVLDQAQITFSSPLHVASAFFQHNMFEYFSQQPQFLTSDLPFALDISGKTLIQVACESNNVHTLQLCKPYNSPETSSEKNPTNTSGKLSEKLSETISEKNPGLNFRGAFEARMSNGRTDGGTVLHTAAINNSVDVCQFLLDMISNSHLNIDVNAKIVGDFNKAETNGTALHFAAMFNNFEIVRLLLTAENIDASVADHYGDTPLHLATEAENTDSVRLLLSFKGTDINAHNKNGWTAFHFAVRSPNLSLAKYFFAFPETKPDETTPCGFTPFMWAVIIEQTEMMEYLLSRREIDFNHKDNKGQTALHFAAEGRNEHSLQLLLQLEDLDVNVVDSLGMTPLLRAASHDQWKNVALLMEDERTNVSVKTSNGKTVVDYINSSKNPPNAALRSQILNNPRCPPHSNCFVL